MTNKNFAKDMADAVNDALKRKGLSARQASIAVVGHDGLIRDIRAGRIPSADRLAALYDYLDLEAYFGPKREAQTSQVMIGFSEAPTKDRSVLQQDRVYLPMPYSSAAVGKTGAGPVAFRQDWFDSLGLPPDTLRVINVLGDGMRPSIPAGSLVLVDEGQRKPLDNKPFAIRQNRIIDATNITRLDQYHLTLLPSNPLRSPTVIDTRKAGDFAIIGRIVWSSQNWT